MEEEIMAGLVKCCFSSKGFRDKQEDETSSPLTAEKANETLDD